MAYRGDSAAKGRVGRLDRCSNGIQSQIRSSIALSMIREGSKALGPVDANTKLDMVKGGDWPRVPAFRVKCIDGYWYGK